MKRILIFPLALAFCQASAQIWQRPSYITKIDSCVICGATIQWQEKASQTQWSIDPGFGHTWDGNIRIDLWPDSLNARHIAWNFDWTVCKQCFDRYAPELLAELNDLRNGYLWTWQRDNAISRIQWREHRLRQAIEERDKKIRELQEEINKLKEHK